MSVLEDYPFPVGPSGSTIRLRLRHYLGERGESLQNRAREWPAVLLLHGGNTSSDTFILPQGGLARHLCAQGLDVWLLDWRSSPYVLQQVLEAPPLGGSNAAERALYTLDRVVDEDIVEALRQLRLQIGDVPLSVVGHCLGAGALSLAIARGRLLESGIQNVVLSTLGLFYEVPWNGWFKAEDFILERVLHQSPHCRDIDPNRREAWPPAFRQAYDRWPQAWLPQGTSPAARLLQNLTFMFGQPYAEEALHESLQGSILTRQFGPMHMGLYQHIGQMVRRGYAARFDAPDVIDRPRRRLRRAAGHPTRQSANTDPPASPSDFAAEPFLGMQLTLICAAENQLWHRDSIDLMYDWLRSIHCNGRRVACAKRVFAGYRIQELLWGKRAKAEVYDSFLAGVRGEL
jgi:pimeloyl-ACP methyl ester carboxylesterase